MPFPLTVQSYVKRPFESDQRNGRCLLCTTCHMHPARCGDRVHLASRKRWEESKKEGDPGTSLLTLSVVSMSHFCVLLGVVQGIVPSAHQKVRIKQIISCHFTIARWVDKGLRLGLPLLIQLPRCAILLRRRRCWTRYCFARVLYIEWTVWSRASLTLLLLHANHTRYKTWNESSVLLCASSMS